MRVRFRGVGEREAVLLRGPQGWAEWAPFVEYADLDAARWLAAALELGWGELPAPVRAAVGVNATVPAVAADRVEGVPTVAVPVPSVEPPTPLGAEGDQADEA